MADKKLSVGAKVFLIVLLCLLCGLSAAIFGCASAPKKIEKLTYECPSCRYKVDASSVNKNIRMENICQSCGKSFFYTTAVELEKEKSGGYSFGYRPYCPWCRVWVYRYRTTRFHSYQHHGH